MGLTLDDTLAVGDGANDLPMLEAAGLGVAYRAKPKVAAARARARRPRRSYGAALRAGLCAQGFRRGVSAALPPGREASLPPYSRFRTSTTLNRSQ